MQQRSDPDEILKQIVKLSSGRHRLYLGMAPGVGKTYKMLEEAIELKKRNVDIVIGYIEMQERSDNLTLINNFEIIKRKSIQVGDKVFYELDLETLLERKPACVVIDELAHSNIPGSLNQKRYQDIQELLKKGISVLSTINVHQIESIAPIVEKNLGIKIAETVPDWVINSVDELIVVDLSIDELYKRLELGKIYPDEQLKHALKNFFKRNNLLMLRDLTLNFLAERVDTQVATENLKARIKERILVGLTSHKDALKTLSTSVEIAKLMHASLDVICLSPGEVKNENKVINELRNIVKELNGNFILANKNSINISDMLIKHLLLNRITLLILENKNLFNLSLIKNNVIKEILSKVSNIDVLITCDKPLYSLQSIEINKQSNVNPEFKPGELKIYIGMAPGVGKTFKMLQEANEAYENKKNILLGVIDTHGRVETAKLMNGLPLLPQRIVKHQNKHLYEFDLEAAILAKPEIIYVDELAHTNVPGSINNKRYQDVQYLLRAGINVVTTVNIQHIESLNDIVEQFSGIKVRETVPDWIISHANEIVLVDISPEALQERLKEGKVYSLDKIEQALTHFFQKKNLIALRELSLREVAENVEHELYPKQKDIKIVAFIDINEDTLRLIRKSARIANRFQAELIVVHIVSSTEKLIESRKLSIIELEELVVELGGDFRLVESNNVINEIKNLVSIINPFLIVFSETLKSEGFPFLKKDLMLEIINCIYQTNILVIGRYSRD